MAKLRMPVSSEFKVFTGEGNGSVSQGGGNGEVHSDVPFDTDEPGAAVEPTAADTATAMLEGDDGPEGGVDCDPLGDYGDGLPVLDETPVDIEQPTALADEPEPIIITPEEMAADNAADTAEEVRSGGIGLSAAETTVAVERYRARREFEEAVAAAKDRLVECTLEYADLKGKTKAAKDEQEEAVEKLSDLIARGWEAFRVAKPQPPIAERVDDGSNDATGEPTTLVESSGEAKNLTAEDIAAHLGYTPNTDTSWRSRPITELSGSITPKIIERLQEDGIHTIGQLEDRRAKCYDNTGEWPKGIGKVKITAIEDALLDWLTANRDKAVFAELESGHASEQAEEQPGECVSDGESEESEDEAAANADDATSLAPATSPATSYTTPDDVAAMIRRSQQINDGSDGCLSSKYLDAIWTEGYEAFQAGKSFEQCDYRPGNTQDDWLRGWMAAQATKDYPAAEEKEEGKPVAKAAQSQQRELYDADDI